MPGSLLKGSGPCLAVVTLAIVLTWPPGCRATLAASDPGNYRDAPVYYEVQPSPPHLERHREILHKNKVKLLGFPEVDLTGWNWENGPLESYSWWIQIEELRFLLPLLKSESPRDRELARKWFNGWYDTHLQKPRGTNRARWGEPMSAAYRGMVLVYFLKTEENRDDGDADLITRLRALIREHQEFLADPKNFDRNSNHGMVEAFGLLEVSRVFPNQRYQTLGLDRLLEITQRSVSGKGSHKEHAPAYHFAFLTWLDRFSSYLLNLPHLDEGRVGELLGYRRRMLSCAYYFHDHDGTVPEIGDVDSMNVFLRFPEYGVRESEGKTISFFDPEAGFAIYKSPETYLVFAIQNVRPKLPLHFHDDVLSVYFRLQGETILGDPGKYDYTPSDMRDYFRSMPVHNTVFPRTRPGKTVRLARNVKFITESGAVGFIAVSDFPGEFSVSRNVVVPHGEGGLLVSDSFRRLAGAGTAGRSRKPASGVTDRRRRTQRYKAHATWNFGYDVRSVEELETAANEQLAYSITTRNGRRLRFSVALTGENAPQLQTTLVRGETSPRAGWYSPRLYVMRPCYTLLLTLDIQGTARMVTRVEQMAE